MGPKQQGLSVPSNISGRRAQVGETLELDDVLLVGSATATVVGRPTVPDARVVCAVEEQTKDAKVVVFKKRRRQNSRRRNGHRRKVTLLRVLDIVPGAFDVAAAPGGGDT